LLGNGEDFLLCAVNHRVDFGALIALVAELDDTGTGVDKPAKHRLFRNDFRIVARVGCVGNGLDEVVEVRATADAVQIVGSIEATGDNHGVNITVVTEQVNDRLENQLVGRPVEVYWGEDRRKVDYR